MNLVSRWRLALASLLTALVAPAALAQEGDVVVHQIGDTTVEASPGVGVSGQTLRVQIRSTQAPKRLPGPLQYKLVFNRASSEDYDVTLSAAEDASYELYRGGLRVAAGDMADGLAPFSLARVPDFFDAEPATASDGHREQIELSSWSLGTSVAHFDDGRVLTFDRLVVRGDADLDGDVTASEVPLVDDLAIVLPTGGLEQRVRFRVGDVWGPWSAWSRAPGEHTLDAPAPGSERVDAYTAERRTAPGKPTIAIHGYIKIKKLNSGG